MSFKRLDAEDFVVSATSVQSTVIGLDSGARLTIPVTITQGTTL